MGMEITTLNTCRNAERFINGHNLVAGKTVDFVKWEKYFGLVAL